MGFRTKIDYSNNRQIKQNVETLTTLSGTTVFGVPYSELPSGPDLSTTGITEEYNFTMISTFSGNNTTTVFDWYDDRMDIATPYLSAITPSISAETQTIDAVFTPNQTTIIDGNVVNLNYSGVGFTLNVNNMIDMGGGTYSGSVETNDLLILSASSIDYSGRTIWVDVTGITRTNRLILTNGAQPNYVLGCINNEGLAGWVPSSGGTSNSLWISGTGVNSITTADNQNFASGISSLSTGASSDAEGNYSTATGQYAYSKGFASHAEGYNTSALGDYSHAEGYHTTASGNTSHAEGGSTIASGSYSHAEGYDTKAYGNQSHAEGRDTKSNGNQSHSEGTNTEANGDSSHSQGQYSISNGIASFAGGHYSVANGDYSFVFGDTSVANNNNVNVLGANITGTTADTTYVDYFNIKRILSNPFTNDIRIDANGNLTTNTSDIRLKENIVDITNALDIIKNVKGVKYQWKDRNAGGNDIKYGFIAQDLEEVIPDLVFTNKNDGYKGIHIDGLIPLIIEALKELITTKTINNVNQTETVKAEDNNIELNYNGTEETSVGGGIIVLNTNNGNNSELITNNNGDWVTNNLFKPLGLEIPQNTPINSNDVNISGNICYDNNYLYVKPNNVWKRIKLEDF